MPAPTTWIADANGGCLLTIKATPRASRTEIAGADAAWLRIRLQAPPVAGRANEALVAFLASTLKLPKRAIAVIAGETGRIKKVRVAGMGVAAVRARLCFESPGNE